MPSSARRASAAAFVSALVGLAMLASPTPSGAATTVTVKLPQAVCKTPPPGERACYAIRLVKRQVSPATAASLTAAGLATQTDLGSGPAGGYTPAQLAAAYGVNPDRATHQTVAIVDAFDAPSITSDLAAFDTHYGFAAETSTSFRVVNQTGAASPLPTADTTWAPEITLDVEAVRSLCRQCRILLVEADSEHNGDLAAAVDEAVSKGATIVSNSYGSTESDPENTPSVVASYHHPGVAILAASGDEGWYGFDVFNLFFPFPSTTDAAPATPASFTHVIGVGGTSLYLDPDGTRASEQVWNDNGSDDIAGLAMAQTYGVTAGAEGSGCSSLYAPPKWQRSMPTYGTLGCGTALRNSVDIAADADGFTGLDTYETFGWCSTSCPADGWATYGGTSLATPLVAALWGLAGGTHGVTDPALTLYGNDVSTPGSTYDVRVGGSGACDTGSPASCLAFFGDNPNSLGFGPLDCAFGDTGTTVLADRAQCYARPGYDGVSGVGTPKGLGVFAAIAPTATITHAGSVTHGVSHSFSAATSTDPFPGGSLVRYHWTWGDGTSTTTTSATASHTYQAAGTRTVTLKVTDSYGRTDTATRQVAVS